KMTALARGVNCGARGASGLPEPGAPATGFASAASSPSRCSSPARARAPKPPPAFRRKSRRGGKPGRCEEGFMATSVDVEEFVTVDEHMAQVHGGGGEGGIDAGRRGHGGGRRVLAAEAGAEQFRLPREEAEQGLALVGVGAAAEGEAVGAVDD